MLVHEYKKGFVYLCLIATSGFVIESVPKTIFVSTCKLLMLTKLSDAVFHRQSVPETWAEFSNNNIKRSQAERANSKAVRVEIADTINRCANEMWNQWNKVRWKRG